MIALIIYVCISQQPYHFPPTCLYIYKYIHISINPTISLHFFRHRFIIFYQNKRKVLPAEQKGGGRFHGLATRIAARWAAQEYMYYLNKYYRVKKVEEWINFEPHLADFSCGFFNSKTFFKDFFCFPCFVQPEKGNKRSPPSDYTRKISNDNDYCEQAQIQTKDCYPLEYAVCFS